MGQMSLMSLLPQASHGCGADAVPPRAVDAFPAIDVNDAVQSIGPAKRERVGAAGRRVTSFGPGGSVRTGERGLLAERSADHAYRMGLLKQPWWAIAGRRSLRQVDHVPHVLGVR